MRRFMISTAHQILSGWSNKEEWKERATLQACEGGELHTGFWRGDLRERYHLEDLSVDGIVTIKWILKKWNSGALTSLLWLRIGTEDGLLWMRLWTFEIHKIQGIFWLSEELLASQERLYSMGLVSHLFSWLVRLDYSIICCKRLLSWRDTNFKVTEAEVFIVSLQFVGSFWFFIVMS
jgi:hypothetical protein